MLLNDSYSLAGRSLFDVLQNIELELPTNLQHIELDLILFFGSFINQIQFNRGLDHFTAVHQQDNVDLDDLHDKLLCKREVL